MSHLGTLIDRIRKKERWGVKIKDSSFQTTLVNLAEYMRYYSDYTSEERAEAEDILVKYNLGYLINATQEELDEAIHKAFIGKLDIGKWKE